jgi:hypothetical protein
MLINNCKSKTYANSKKTYVENIKPTSIPQKPMSMKDF